MANIVLFPVLLCIIGLPVWIGIYVYRDTARRGMNAALWTLVVLLAPALVGFIIYLLVRGSYSDLKCPECATSIREDFVACPRCGTKLRPVCPSCENPVDLDWKVCPKCTRPLPGHYDNVTVPVRPKDRSLKRILIAVIVIPILVISLCITLFSIPTSGGGSASVMTEITLEELYSTQQNDQVKQWIESIPQDTDKAYALCFEGKNTNGEKFYSYLIYAPVAGSGGVSGTEFVHGGWFHDNLQVELYGGEGEADTVSCVVVSYEKELELVVFCDSREIECEVTKVDFDPTEDILDPMELVYDEE